MSDAAAPTPVDEAPVIDPGDIIYLDGVDEDYYYELKQENDELVEFISSMAITLYGVLSRQPDDHRGYCMCEAHTMLRKAEDIARR